MRMASVFICGLGLLLGGCSPRLDWRQVQDDASGLQFLLPCKPERATRPIALPNARTVTLRMVGCETAGALYALSFAELEDEATLAQIWAAWPQAVQKAMKATALEPAAFHTPGLMRAERLMQQTAQGRKADGSPVQAELMWVARDRRIVHLAVYLDRRAAPWSEPFWDALKWP